MKMFNVRERFAWLFEHLQPKKPTVCTMTVRVDEAWAVGKTPSVVENCLGAGAHIDHIIRQTTGEVLPRSLDCAIRRGDVLLMHVESTSLRLTEAFIGRSLENV